MIGLGSDNYIFTTQGYWEAGQGRSTGSGVSRRSPEEQDWDTVSSQSAGPVNRQCWGVGARSGGDFLVSKLMLPGLWFVFASLGVVPSAVSSDVIYVLQAAGVCFVRAKLCWVVGNRRRCFCLTSVCGPGLDQPWLWLTAICSAANQRLS